MGAVPEAPPADRELLQLASERLLVRVWPRKGCDVVSLVDREKGVELLWQAPWGRRDPGLAPWAASSPEHWVQRVSGGWNVLLPHAGPPREEAGAQLGFHGEAGIVSWSVERADERSAAFRTSLVSAPLTVRRTVGVEGDTLVVEESVTNDSPDPARFSWGHHPTFGAPLVGDGCRIEIPARTVELDADMPAVGLPVGCGRAGRWPLLGGVDLSVVPSGDEPRALLAYLGELDEGRCRIVNDRLGLGVELRWPLELFPHVWLWQELHGSAGYPWFRRAYAMAVEPHSTIPQGGPPALALAPGERRDARLTARVE